ncbi:hypothetical protein ACLB2K_006258 [Fragaria x ananassa]
MAPSDDSPGVAFLWMNDVPVQIRTYSACHVDVTIGTPNSPEEWRLTGIYGYARIADRSGAFRRLAQMQAFREAMTDCALLDMGALGSPFTWADHLTKERLDRSLWNVELRALFLKSSTTHLHPSTSDHNPLLVEVCTTPSPHRRRRRLFRFDQVWAAHPECETVITRSWESEVLGDPINQTTKKIKQTSVALSAWQKPTFMFRQAEMQAVRNKLNDLLAAPFYPAQNEEKKVLNDKLQELLTAEETMWIHRSKALWLKVGDRTGPAPRSSRL